MLVPPSKFVTMYGAHRARCQVGWVAAGVGTGEEREALAVIESSIRGHHVLKARWTAGLGEQLDFHLQAGNDRDCYIVIVILHTGLLKTHFHSPIIRHFAHMRKTVHFCSN